jgi:hypothetical protein
MTQSTGKYLELYETLIEKNFKSGDIVHSTHDGYPVLVISWSHTGWWKVLSASGSCYRKTDDLMRIKACI